MALRRFRPRERESRATSAAFPHRAHVPRFPLCSISPPALHVKSALPPIFQEAGRFVHPHSERPDLAYIGTPPETNPIGVPPNPHPSLSFQNPRFRPLAYESAPGIPSRRDSAGTHAGIGAGEASWSASWRSVWAEMMVSKVPWCSSGLIHKRKTGVAFPCGQLIG